MTEVNQPSSTPTFVLHQVAWDDPRAQLLRDAMDIEMQARYAGRAFDPDAVSAALTVNPADVTATVLVTSQDSEAVGHGALRMLRGEWEVKRVIVVTGSRELGIGRLVMNELETIARLQGAPRVILQTGDRQPEAVQLYERLGYTRIPIYEPYVEAIPFSICFEKQLHV